VLGSALVWVPGTIVLLSEQRYAAAAILGVIGFVVASNIDNLVRPIVFRRVSHVHPLISIVGAFAGMRYFGLLGVLLGPLALVYFLELVHAYSLEHGGHVPDEPRAVAAPPDAIRGMPTEEVTVSA
jgi:predicted PurR-regulated permease PerM